MRSPMPIKPWEPTEKELEKVESLAARGMGQDKIALCLGIHPDTLGKKKKHIELLNLAIKRGKARGTAMVTKALLKNIELGNVTAQIFWLKCQDRWRDQDTDNTFKESEEGKAKQKAQKERAKKCLKKY